MKQLPFNQPGRFWKGNLHTHCTASDGTLSAEVVCQRYREAGYDFLAITDHFMQRYDFPITDTRPYRGEGFTTILGAELHTRAVTTELSGVWHILAVGLPFANPGTRFWKAVREAGFTDRVLGPWERDAFLDAGLGMTNVVRRATARADELTPDEIVDGGRRLVETAEIYRPRWVAVLGLGAYRTAFGDRRATAGPQERRIGPARAWLLPNPSGLNASFPGFDSKLVWFERLARWLSLVPARPAC